jgi:hypothetical protein
MGSILAVFQLSLLFSALGFAHPSDLSPFILALDGEETVYTNNDTSPQSEDQNGSLDLFKRQNCAADYYYCSTIVSTAVCCSTNAVCSQDNAGNAACCPLGSYCTGTIPIPSSVVATPTTTTTNLLTTTDSNGAPIIITAIRTQVITTVAATDFTTALTSYVSNPYDFPFPYIATTFGNSAACAAAYSSCASEYTVCTSDLQGGAGYGVTISAPGGGTTVAQSTGTSLGVASAASVCASLSAVACPGIAGGCAVFGTAAAATATSFVAGSEARRRAGDMSWSLWAGGVVAVLTGIVGWVL